MNYDQNKIWGYFHYNGNLPIGLKISESSDDHKNWSAILKKYQEAARKYNFILPDRFATASPIPYNNIKCYLVEAPRVSVIFANSEYNPISINNLLKLKIKNEWQHYSSEQLKFCIDDFLNQYSGLYFSEYGNPLHSNMISDKWTVVKKI